MSCSLVGICKREEESERVLDGKRNCIGGGLSWKGERIPILHQQGLVVREVNGRDRGEVNTVSKGKKYCLRRGCTARGGFVLVFEGRLESAVSAATHARGLFPFLPVKDRG